MGVIPGASSSASWFSTGISAGAISERMTTISCTAGPTFSTSNVTGPAGTLVGAGSIEKSSSVTATLLLSPPPVDSSELHAVSASNNIVAMTATKAFLILDPPNDNKRGEAGSSLARLHVKSRQ